MEKVGAYTERATEVGEWRPGNPATGQQATPMLAEYFNMLQRELIALVQAGGLTLDVENDSQLLQAIRALIEVSGNFATDGTTNITVDWNGITAQGLYPQLLGAENPNGPGGGGGWFYGFVIRHHSQALTQVAFPYSTGVEGAWKWRTLYSTTWTPWRMLYHDGNLVQATEATLGLLRHATVDEARALTHQQSALTPFTLDQTYRGANQVLGSTLVQRLPGGFILQTGSVTVSAEAGGSSDVPVLLPVAYPNVCKAFATFQYSGAINDNANSAQLRNKSLAGFSVQNQWSGASNNIGGVIDWFTIGY